MTDLRTFVRWQDVHPAAVAGRTVVVIDVLRWSTVVVTALAHGAAWLEAFASAEEAAGRAAELRVNATGVLLGGERATRALPGFDVGNSPGEYTRERVQGRVVVSTTTNGTQALTMARGAHEVLVAALVNVDAVVARLRDARAARRGITLIAAGTEGAEASEDTGCAGAIAAGLLDAQATGESDLDAAAGRGPSVAKSSLDAATLRAIARWDGAGRDAARLVGDAPHAATLVANGFAADVGSAARLSVPGLLVVPRRGAEGRISI